MNNLYRDLAPITEAAWAEIELEATRTFKRHIAGRRVVDVSEPGGPVTAAISTGHLRDVAPPGDGVVAHLRESKPLVRLRVPFTVSRTAIDDVERGSQDSDWDPVKDAAKKLAFVEDRAIFEGYDEAAIEGIRGVQLQPCAGAARGCPRDFRRHRPGAVASCGWRASTARIRCCCRPTRTPRSARPPNTAIRSASISTGWSTARSSGRLPSTALSCCPPAAATSICSSAPTCRSAICRMTRARSTSICRRP